MKVGILALQGAFAEHQSKMEALGVETFQIRNLADLKPMDGLILPGGESTAMRKLMDDLGLFDPLFNHIHHGLPVFGTCAGMILLANHIQDSSLSHLRVLDITVNRNAYGRQLGSFKTTDLFDGTVIPMTFIRAPYIASYGQTVIPLSTVDGKREKNILVTAFHPELTDSNHVHLYFLQMITRVAIDQEGTC